MCEIGNRAEVTPAEALPATLEWKGEVLPLEPVDELSVLTVCDDVPRSPTYCCRDEGPAKRLPLAAMARLAPLLEAPTIVGGKAADVPLAQHGFLRAGGDPQGRPGARAAVRRPGSRPTGAPATCADLGQDPASASRRSSAVTAALDHTTELSGLIGRSAGRTCRC